MNCLLRCSPPRSSSTHKGLPHPNPSANRFQVLKLADNFKGIGTSCHHTTEDLHQRCKTYITVKTMIEEKTYSDRLQDTLDLDSRKFAIPGSCQVPGDEHLQVDWLENLNVRLRAILLQRGSKNQPSCFSKERQLEGSKPARHRRRLFTVCPVGFCLKCVLLPGQF